MKSASGSSDHRDAGPSSPSARALAPFDKARDHATPKVPDMQSPAELPAAGVRFQWSKNRTGAGRIRWRSDRRNMVRRTRTKTASRFPAAHRGAMIRGPMSHTLWIFPSARPGQGYALREKRLRANPKPPSRPARQTRYEGSGTVENEVNVATFPFAGPLTVSNASAN
jgi:hypothetical protein